MRFNAFEKAAEAAWDDVPDEYKVGIDRLVVSREALPHPELPEIYTLGMCDTEAYPSEWVGPDTTRSVVILYYGSFAALARKDPGFDWEAEIHETVEHEIKHHLESLAGQDQLGDVDYAMDEDFKRRDGLDFDSWYWQRGDVIGAGMYAVEDHVFIEQEWSAPDFETAAELRFPWKGVEWAIARPDELGDVHFVWITGVDDAPPALELVLVRRRSWWEDVKRMVGSSRLRVLESEAEARRA
jgi:hypothetical protein